MAAGDTIYILGGGAVGFPLAAYLANAGRRVVVVRTARDVPPGTVAVNVMSSARRCSARIDTVSLARLARLEGPIVVAAKSYANGAIARALKDKVAGGPIVVMQNGIGVERPFLEAGLRPVYRCVLYVTAQHDGSEYDFAFRPIAPSPIGVVDGDPSGLECCVTRLNTDGFPFRSEADIARETWKKATINTVFNSICPLLETDNGVFVRDAGVADLARMVVRECLALTQRLGIGLDEAELMEQIARISRGSDGQLISTLQDIRAGRPTEIEFLNLEIARVAASLAPPLELARIALLGQMIAAKSRLGS